MIDGVTVDYYGQMSPLNQVGIYVCSLSKITCYRSLDKSLIPTIEKAILAANIGFTPSNDGKIIRLVVPELTEERK